MTPGIDTGSASDPHQELPTHPKPLGVSPRAGRQASHRARRLGIDDVAQRIVLDVADRIAVGSLESVLPEGTVVQCGPAGTTRPLRLVVRNPRFFARVLRRPRVSVGEAYVDGDWETDDLPGVLRLLILSVERARGRRPFAAINSLGRYRPPLRLPQTKRRAEQDIHYHYDLGNDFFRLFLDESMTYSCAHFLHPSESLEEAQRNKYRRICEKLHLTANDHVLEIGCGWGGFAAYAAEEFGARITSLTISRKQFEFARQRIVDAGLADRVEIRYQDYRETSGRFSRIVSIEMLEAIGHSQLGTFFAACDRLLEPDGLACIQSIAMPDQRYERYRRQTDWIRKYIFPGANLPSLDAVSTAMTRSSELTIHEVEDIGIHYAATLRIWRERFHANIDRVRALGYDQRFERMWDFYLAACEAGFELRALRDLQLVLTRPLNGSLPRFT
ncbi:MAG: class I SAM-dependent methyltransferase [Gaiellaceae bacterium]